MGGRATVVQSDVEGRGLDVRQRVPLRDHAGRGCRPARRPGGARGPDRRTASSTSTHEDVPPPADESTIAVVGLRQPRARVVHGQRPPAHRRGARGAPSRPDREAVAAHPGVGLLMVRSAEHGAVVFGPNGVALPRRRTASKARTRRLLFGPHTVMSLKREDAMAHAPDLLPAQPVRPGARRGRRVRGADRLARRPGRPPDASRSSSIPAEWELDEPVPLGAPAIYRNIRRWLASIGIDLAKAPAPVVEPATESAGIAHETGAAAAAAD